MALADKELEAVKEQGASRPVPVELKEAMGRTIQRCRRRTITLPYLLGTNSGRMRSILRRRDRVHLEKTEPHRLLLGIHSGDMAREEQKVLRMVMAPVEEDMEPFLIMQAVVVDRTGTSLPVVVVVAEAAVQRTSLPQPTVEVLLATQELEEVEEPEMHLLHLLGRAPEAGQSVQTSSTQLTVRSLLLAETFLALLVDITVQVSFRSLCPSEQESDLLPLSHR